ncbi:MAG TPA: SMI1/KNR4 family protein [Abditibacteriaceae bacterium]|jgi:hypothetical protein
MEDFTSQYRAAFSNLGRPLKDEDAISEEEIIAVETRLSCVLPASLKDFVRVAGRADDFFGVFDRLISLEEWCLDDGKLVFMEENQAVVLWGVELEKVEDPPVFQATNAAPLAWDEVSACCSKFLMTMLHFEATFGGAMPFCGSAVVKPQIRTQLDKEWNFVGEVTEIRAYHQSGCALCFTEWDGDWQVFAGATEQSTLNEIAKKLKIEFEDYD